MSTVRRVSWVAGLLSFITPGLGHVYAGQPKRGITLYALLLLAIVASAIIGMFSILPAPFNVASGLLILLSLFMFTIVDAIRLARKQGEAYQLRAYNKWYLYIAISVAAGIIFGLFSMQVRSFLMRAYKIPIGSMAPSLLAGDHIYADKLIYHFINPVRGDVVIFKYPEDETKEFVKRIIGLPGESLELRDKKVWINGQVLTEDYIQHVDPTILPHQVQPRDNLGPIQVPQDAYYVLGDNRDQSLDSRFFGPVHRIKITGKARTIYWSFSNGVRWERIGQPVR